MGKDGENRLGRQEHHGAVGGFTGNQVPRGDIRDVLADVLHELPAGDHPLRIGQVRVGQTGAEPQGDFLQLVVGGDDGGQTGGVAVVENLEQLFLCPRRAAFGAQIVEDEDGPQSVGVDGVLEALLEALDEHGEAAGGLEGRILVLEPRRLATRLVADTVSFNHKAMTALATGHVVMTAGNDILTGERVELDMGQETGVVHGGTIFLHENHFYIRGERIEKTVRRAELLASFARLGRWEIPPVK